MNAKTYVPESYKFNALFNTITDGIAIFRILHNSNGQPEDYLIENINQSFRNETGLNNEDLIGISIKRSNSIFNEDIDWFKSFNELYNKRLNGNNNDMELETKNHSFTILCDDDYITVIVKKNINVRDTYSTKYDTNVGEKREDLYQDIAVANNSVEKILEYDRIKTDFFSNISHEFKTPLNVILGTLQLMNLYIKDASVNNLENKMKHKISIMQQNCYRLLRLVNNIIDITRIERGYYQISMENHNIIEIIEVIALSVKDYIEAKEIKFSFATDINHKITACDPEKIERIVLNLLSNAIKFTKPGGEISVYIKDKGNNLQISVKDTGIGIPKEKTEVIFERFIQVEKSFAKDNIGSGIGLSLVKSLVDMHKGSIYVESQINKGSEFIIELPIFTIESEEIITESNSDYKNGPVEKINIEFSDIYYHR